MKVMMIFCPKNICMVMIKIDGGSDDTCADIICMAMRTDDGGDVCASIIAWQ